MGYYIPDIRVFKGIEEGKPYKAVCESVAVWKIRNAIFGMGLGIGAAVKAQVMERSLDAGFLKEGGEGRSLLKAPANHIEHMGVVCGAFRN